MRGKGSGHTGWIQNVATWIDYSKYYPFVFVRYEDLLADTEREVRRILKFLNLELDTDVIRRAIQLSSFENMKKIEEHEIREKKQGFYRNHRTGNGHEKGVRFMNQGKLGKGIEFLTDKYRQPFMDRFGELMQRLGYGVDFEQKRIIVGKSPLTSLRPLEEQPLLGIAKVNRRHVQKKVTS